MKIVPEGVNIFACENGYSMETVCLTPDGEHIIKRYVGDLATMLQMTRSFFMEDQSTYEKE